MDKKIMKKNIEIWQFTSMFFQDYVRLFRGWYARAGHMNSIQIFTFGANNGIIWNTQVLNNAIKTVSHAYNSRSKPQ